MKTVIDIHRCKENLQDFAMKFDMGPSKDKKDVAHKHKHVKVSQSGHRKESVY